MSHSHYREDIIEAIETRLMSEHPEVAKGKIFGHPGFMVNRRVFCFVYEDGLCMKLSKSDYEDILKLDNTEKFAPMGERPMGTWVVLTYPEAEEYLDNWHWLEKSLEYIVTDEAAPPKKSSKRKPKLPNA